MNDTQIVIVLNARQVERLQRQVKALYNETFDYATLQRWRDVWAAELAFLKLDPNLLPDVDALLAEMETGDYTEATLDSARTRVACYRPASWSLLKEIGVDLSAHMNDFGAVDPALKARFRKQYEKKHRLSNQAQADWLKEIALPWVDAWLDGRMAMYERARRHVERREKVGSVINAAKRFLGRR